MNEQAAAPIVVLMTAGSREEAVRLAEMLVGSRLSACVQILPEMESVYHWKGKVRRDPEHLLLAKTTEANFEELEREVRALHSYETPEIVALPVTAASAPYLEWLQTTVISHRQPQTHKESDSLNAKSAAQTSDG
jgi:periplasmic divalent cation tolerance protein